MGLRHPLELSGLGRLLGAAYLAKTKLQQDQSLNLVTIAQWKMLGLALSHGSWSKLAKRELARTDRENPPCYDATVFNFGSAKTTGDWIVHLAGAIVAIFLVWWMLRLYVL